MTLLEVIENHRTAYRDELIISRMVSRQPPTSLDLHTGTLNEEPAAAIGMTISGSLLRRLGHPEGYGNAYPWMRALWLLKVECRRKHPHHRSAERPFWRGSLCHQAVKLVIIGGEAFGTGPLEAETAARILRLDHIEPLLRGAFRIIDEQMDLQRWRAARRVREDAGYSSVNEARSLPHHVPSAEHMAECPNPVCRAEGVA